MEQNSKIEIGKYKNIYTNETKFIRSFEDFMLFSFIGIFIFDKLLPLYFYQIFGIFFISYYIFRIISYGKIAIFKGILWQIGFIIMVIISLIYSNTLMISHIYTVFTTSTFIFIVLQYFICHEDIILKTNNILNYFSFWGTLFMIYILITQWSTFIDGGRLGSRALVEEFGNAIAFSYYSIIITIVLIWKSYNTSKYKVLHWVLVGVSIFINMMTGGRKAVFLPVIFLIVYLILLNKKNIKKLFKYSLFAIVIIAVLFYLSINAEPIYNVFGIRMETLLYTIFGIGSSDARTMTSDLIRKALISDGIQLFISRPFLGYGLAASRDLYNSIGLGYIHAHNNYIDLLISGGILMFISWYWIYPYLLLKLFKIYKYNDSDLASFYIAFIIVNLISDWGSTMYNVLHFNLFVALSSVFIEAQEFKG